MRDEDGRSRRVAIVVGTRPEAIKLAPVAAAMRGDDRFRPTLITTGQHGSSVNEALGLLGVDPDVTLSCERSDDSLASLHAILTTQLDDVVQRLRPDIVVVEGDTSSAFVGAQAGFWNGALIAHVEAGLRSGNLRAPFPEEANRRLIAALTRVHLAPTDIAAANLAAEGVSDDMVYVIGNTVIDALQQMIAADAPPDPWNSSTVVVTAHRRESWGAPMDRIVSAIDHLATRFPGHRFVVATHMNPSVQAQWARIAHRSNVELSAPLDYRNFIRLLSSAKLVISDSGGVQEEAPAFGVPVLVTRDVTERVEGVLAGIARIVGTDPELIIEDCSQLLTDNKHFAATSQAINPYGDGKSAGRVLDALWHAIGRGPRPISFSPDISQRAGPASRR